MRNVGRQTILKTIFVCNKMRMIISLKIIKKKKCYQILSYYKYFI